MELKKDYGEEREKQQTRIKQIVKPVQIVNVRYPDTKKGINSLNRNIIDLQKEFKNEKNGNKNED